MESELNLKRNLNGGIKIDFSRITSGKEQELYDEIVEILYSKLQETGVRYFSGHMLAEPGQTKITRGAIDVIFDSKDILSYQQLEKYMQSKGYPVKFSRELAIC